MNMIALSILGLSFSLLGKPVVEERTGPPNFIIIYVDDLGWADTSVPMMQSDPLSGSDFHLTPHLDQLAARGMTFSNGYAPAPTCTPSRTSIQFGKTPGRLKYTFVNDVLATQNGLDWADELSLADVVKAADTNYITAHFGKGMGQNRMEEIGYDVHDEFDTGPNGNAHGDYADTKNKIPNPPEDPKRIYSLRDRSVDFVEEHAGKRPFFLMVSHYAVHVTHAASTNVIDKYFNLPRGRYSKDGDYVDPYSPGRLMYAAMIDEVDATMGEVIAAVEQAGELDNTYIIYTSDNGGGGPNPNGPLEGGKARLYEGGLRVPWVIAGPGVLPGVQCDEPIAQWDLLPSLHDLSGSEAPLPDDLDGGSLRPLLEYGNTGRVQRPVEGFVFHYPCYFAPPLSVIRLGDYKYMKHLNTGEFRLFNLQSDYAEEHDLAASMPEKVSELDAALTAYLDAIDAEDVQDVYQARFAQLDQHEAGKVSTYENAVSQLDPVEDADEIAQLDAQLAADLARFEQSRQDCTNWMNSVEW